MAGTVLKRVRPPSKKYPHGLTRWRAVLPLPPDPVTGKRRDRRQDFATRREAQAALSQWQEQQRQGTLVERSNQTVAEMIAYWLDTYAATKKARTQADYTYEVEKHVLPYLGAARIQTLEPKHLVVWHATLHKAGKSPRAIRQAHLRLQQALDQAETLGLVSRNVARKVKPPREEEKPERPTWTAVQARSFLAVAREHCIYGPVFRVALATGMRRGELLGLRWQDVDWQARMLRVRQSIGPVANKMTTGTTKSKAGARDVLVTDKLLNDLREHRKGQNERRLAMCPLWEDLDLVFGSEIGTPIGASNLYREYKRLIGLAGVPHIAIHDQRHTATSWAVASGIDPKTVSERMGHSDVAITMNRYTHTSKKQHRDAAQAIEDHLSDDRDNDADEDVR